MSGPRNFQEQMAEMILAHMKTKKYFLIWQDLEFVMYDEYIPRICGGPYESVEDAVDGLLSILDDRAYSYYMSTVPKGYIVPASSDDGYADEFWTRKKLIEHFKDREFYSVGSSIFRLDSAIC